MLVLGLFVALMLALAAIGWLLLGRAELRARYSAEQVASDAAFAQLTATDAALSQRRDLLETTLAALPAGVEVRDGAGLVLLRNPQALAYGAPFGAGTRLSEIGLLADGRTASLAMGRRRPVQAVKFDRPKPERAHRLAGPAVALG